MLRTRVISRGYTLVELLIVIAVIALLLAGLFTCLGRLRITVQRQDAKRHLEQIMAGLQNYEMRFHCFPPDNDGGRSGAQCLHYFLTTAFSRTPDAARGEVFSTINMAPLSNFQDREMADPVMLGSKTVIDPWHTPIHYQLEKRKYFDPIDPAKFVTIDTPVVYSFGPNKVDDGGTGDDIVGTK
jgi:prepilin-type N-terminal cleavage/methylation domain-containing protein